MKHQTEIALPVELTFEVWEEIRLTGMEMPAELHLKRVMLPVIGPSNKLRYVDITNSISEAQKLLWEEEFLESQP